MRSNMRRYSQLTSEQRYQIFALHKVENTLTKIAEIIGVHKSTISRELRRNRGAKDYLPEQAHSFALERRKGKVVKRLTQAHWHIIEDYLRQDWSPEQISGRLRTDLSLEVSHERIYQYIYENKANGGTLYKHLRCQKIRRKRYGSYSKRGQILNRVSIEERPAIVEEKTRYGDFEVDTVIGKNHKEALVTLVDRSTKYMLIKKVANKSAEAVKNAIIELLLPYKGALHTITADNGKEFAYHEDIAKALGIEFFFAHSYASWER
ncbi:TPA: IS30 family transposase, partial [Salmonella enterica subsp. enterica serovar Typhimurium]|nr:IS30 family transposase [Salmonella enterica subsp. enterica serovar Typhimurium]HAV6938460.1 IS30 family transposase [Salmonella enterica subsp. enterica serovar Typhimurium]